MSATTFWHEGTDKFFAPNDPVASRGSLDDEARSRGYKDADDAVAQQGLESVSQLAQRWGMDPSSLDPSYTRHQTSNTTKDYGPLVMGLAAAPLAIGLGGAGIAALAGAGAGGAASTIPAAFSGGGAMTTAAGEGALAAGSAAGGVGGGIAAGTGVGAGIGTGSGAASLASRLAGGGSTADLLLKTGSAAAGAVLGAKESGDQLQLSRDKMAQDNAQFLASQAQQQKQFDATQGQQQSVQALAASQMDPFAQAKGRERQAMAQALLGGYTPVSSTDGKMSGGIGSALTSGNLANLLAMLSPSASKANEDAFSANAKTASGGRYTPPNQSAVYGGR